MALTQRLQNTTSLNYWRGQIPLEYIYTYGRAGEAYFRHLKDKGTFLGAQCKGCGITYVPPRTYCEKCLARLEGNYTEVASSGTVQTYTVLYQNLDGSRKEEPAIMAVIRLDGTDGGVVHYLGEVKQDEVHIGMKVRAVLRPKRERVGAIHDIKYFKPL